MAKIKTRPETPSFLERARQEMSREVTVPDGWARRKNGIRDWMRKKHPGRDYQVICNPNEPVKIRFI